MARNGCGSRSMLHPWWPGLGGRVPAMITHMCSIVCLQERLHVHPFLVYKQVSGRSKHNESREMAAADNAQIAAIHSINGQGFDHAAACWTPRGCAAVGEFTGSSSAFGFRPASARESWYRVSCRATDGFETCPDYTHGKKHI